MSTATTGRVMGALFLTAFVFYLAGNALVDSAGDSAALISTGALLMLVNSVVVAGIGVLAVRILRPRHETSAYAYLAARTIEAVLLAVGVVFVLLLVPLAGRPAVPAAAAEILREGNRYCYQIAMISLGVGSLLFCQALLRARLVPRPMALWGLVGYAVFLLGAVLEILGHRVGVALSAPGGLFELALGALLLLRGFPADPHLDTAAAGATRPAAQIPVPTAH